MVGRQPRRAAMQRPLLAPPARAQAADRHRGRLAGRPVVVDDLAVLGLEARPRRLVALAQGVVVGVLVLPLPVRVDEVPEGGRLAPGASELRPGARARRRAAGRGGRSRSSRGGVRGGACVIPRSRAARFAPKAPREGCPGAAGRGWAGYFISGMYLPAHPWPLGGGGKADVRRPPPAPGCRTSVLPLLRGEDRRSTPTTRAPRYRGLCAPRCCCSGRREPPQPFTTSLSTTARGGGRS